MIEIKIESRNDYELYVRKELQRIKFPGAVSKEVLKIIMESFDAGLALARNDLTVQVSEL